MPHAACRALPPLLTCSLQFRHVALLVSPRSRRLENAVHAHLPGQTMRLHFKLVRQCCRCLHRLLLF